MKSPVYRALPILLATFALLLLPPLSHARNPNGQWQQLTVSGTPPAARKHHVMVYDPTTNGVYLYGGEDEDDIALDDVWHLNLATMTWSELTPAYDPALGSTAGVPGPRHGHSAGIYVGSPSRLVVFGGRTVAGSPPEFGEFASDLWSLSLGSTPGWTRLSSGPPTQEVCGSCPTLPQGKFLVRNHAAAAVRDTFLYVMGGQEFCGASSGNGNLGFGMRDTWRGSVFGSTGVTRLSGESAAPCATYNDPEHGGPLGLPSHRYWHTMIHDSSYDRLVVFGGEYFESVDGSSAWFTTTAQGNTSWTHIGDAPSGYQRKMHSAVYDPISKRMLVFGGKEPGISGSGAEFASITALDLPSSIAEADYLQEGGDWSTLSPEGTGPGATAEHAAVYDSESDRMIVFGGINGSASLHPNDVWALDFETPPAAVTITGAKGRTNAAISWTAPGDDGNVGTAAAYDLRRSSSPITEGNFSSAIQVTTGSPQSAGSSECVEVTGLVRCNTYYYALKTQDTDGNWSPMSNVLSLTQNCNGGSVICLEGDDASLSVAPVTDFFLRADSPARDRSVIEFGLSPELEGEAMDVAVFDVAGRRVRTLQSGVGEARHYSLVWDHSTDGGASVPAGLYFVRLRAGSQTTTQRIVVAG